MSLNLPGLPVTLPPPDAPLSPNFHDIFIPRVAIESGFLKHPDIEVDLRGGYAYEASPVPHQGGRTNYVDTDKHTFSFGIGITLHALDMLLRHPIAIDLGTQFIYLPSVQTEKTNPADPVGDYRAGGWWVGGALTLSLTF